MRYRPSARPRGCGFPLLRWSICQEVTRAALLHPDIGPGVQKITLSFSHEGRVPRRNLQTWGTCHDWEGPHQQPQRPLPPCRGPSSVGCKFGTYEPDSSRMPHTCLGHRGPPLLPSPLTSPTQHHLHCHSLLTPVTCCSSAHSLRGCLGHTTVSSSPSSWYFRSARTGCHLS